jgi:hypothetical protein
MDWNRTRELYHALLFPQPPCNNSKNDNDHSNSNNASFTAPQISMTALQQQPTNNPYTSDHTQTPTRLSHMQAPPTHVIIPLSNSLLLSTAPTMSSKTRALLEKRQFLIFIRILFKCIDRSNNPTLRLQAKEVVTDCTRRNRMGDSSCSPLQHAIACRLKEIVGDMHWNQAKIYTNYYCQQKKGLQRGPIVSV